MRCARGLKADVLLDLAPERRLPTVHLELLGIELGGGQCGIGRDRVVGRSVFRAQLEFALALVRAVGQTIDREAQVGQYVVVDDVVQEYGIRIEGFLRQDDTIVECAVLADGYVPGLTETLL